MHNPELRNILVQQLKQIINTNYRIKFLPNGNSFTSVKVSVLLIADQITKIILEGAYAAVLFQFEKQNRWPPSSDDP